MSYLIAEGTDEAQRWRRPLPTDRAVVLGRDAEFSTPWDPLISRRHVELLLSDGQLAVRQLVDARNPVFFRGHIVQRAALKPGEHFVIGQTRFTLLDEHAEVTLDAPSPDVQQTFTATDLRALRFSDAGSRIDVLSRLPELFAGAIDDADLHARLVNVLLLGIRHATAAALVAVQQVPEVGRDRVPGASGAPPQKSRDVAPASPIDATGRIDVLHWDRRGSGRGDFLPSRRLILEAVRQQGSVLHLWRNGIAPEFTAAEQADWAFATPLAGDSCRGWALFVAGKSPTATSDHNAPVAVDPAALRDDLKFAELVAGAVAAWRDNQRLLQRQAALKAFFAPQVLEAIGRDDPQRVLAPRSADVTVMFCDLRGFTRASEQQSADLMGLLDRVSQALGVATRQILGHGGVVGDFHGDAVMGFWGWPLQQPEKAVLACRAAMAIQAQLKGEPRGVSPRRNEPGDRDEASPPRENLQGLTPPARLERADFRIGIGIASGTAVAGQIGTADQAKVTVFGPVVNLASRLEALTRRLGADILLDDTSVNEVSGALVDGGRLRRLATIVPHGLESPLLVSQLLPPETLAPKLSTTALEEYDQALCDFTAGRWDNARRRLTALATADSAASFLLTYMSETNNQPLPNFDGAIHMTTK
ncbi:MAG: adenylate/guanylate cyclase domain-containing protein [Planctomycetes bacterium]|nr:adenylate/guanylate cyclase domain-containing protein [Planctomycetota bacterium]